MQDRGFRWATAMLVLLATVGVGVVIGVDASADIMPSYGNRAIVPEHRPSRGIEIVSADGRSDSVDASSLVDDKPTDGFAKDASY